jgi:hypothetical protein
LRAAVGIQWDPTPSWHLGAVVRGPTMLLHEARELTTVQSESSTAAGEEATVRSQLAHGEGGRPALQRSGPARVLVGIGRDVGRGFIAVGGDYQGPLYDERGRLASDVVWNARAGARFAVSDNVAVGLGVFTDRSPTPPTEETARAKVNYYGFTLGTEILRRYQLRNEAQPSLTLATTIALRYAAGFGTLNGIRVDPFSNEFEAFHTMPVDVVLHEVILHLGSSLEL